MSRARFIKNAVIAAIVGTTCGTAAGLWSIRSWPPHVTAAVQTPRDSTVVASSPGQLGNKLEESNTEPASMDQDAKVPIPLKVQATAPQPPLGAGDDQNVLQRARTLAQRPDVRALLELREGIVRRAAAQGEKESASTKSQLDDLDRYLTEARMLRLKLDAQALRASTAAASTLPQRANPPLPER